MSLDIFAGTSLGKSSPPCADSHPPLKMGKGVLCGGNASWPKHLDADVYVALQAGSTSGQASDPWVEDAERVVEIHYSIQDGKPPSDVKRFKKLVDYLCNQLQAGKKVHVGCIGGHGRTGIVLAAVVAQLKGETDAITWVRKRYCKKAVESSQQIDFLHKHYGITKVEGSKEWMKDTVSFPSSHNGSGTPIKLLGTEGPPVKRLIPSGVTPTTKIYAPMASSRSLWKKHGA